MPALDYVRLINGLTVFGFAFERYINNRQLSKLDQKAPPASLKAYFDILKDTSNFVPSQLYLRDKLRFGQLASVVDLFESLALSSTIISIVFGSSRQSGLKLLWDYSGSFRFVQSHGEIVHSLAFMTCSAILSMTTSVPASLYRTFVIEEKHGFNKMTYGLWLKDFVKSQALTAVIGLPVLAAVLKIIMYAGPKFVNYTMAFVIALQIIMFPVFPYVIAPIFNKYKAIQDFKDKPNYIEVAQRVERLAGKLKFPLGRIWVMDGSTRSSHSNAFFYGLPFLTKHIVLYDNLLDQNTPDEVEAVLAHELGHWKFNHSLYMLGFGQVTLFVNLSLIKIMLYNPAMYRAFGFISERPVLIGFTLASSIMQPLDTIINFVVNAISRRNEFQADKFAFDLSNAENKYTENLKRALVKLGDKNKSVTDVDPLWSAYKHSHPTMPERLERLDELVRTEGKKQ